MESASQKTETITGLLNELKPFLQSPDIRVVAEANRIEATISDILLPPDADPDTFEVEDVVFRTVHGMIEDLSTMEKESAGFTEDSAQ